MLAITLDRARPPEKQPLQLPVRATNSAINPHASIRRDLERAKASQPASLPNPATLKAISSISLGQHSATATATARFETMGILSTSYISQTQYDIPQFTMRSVETMERPAVALKRKRSDSEISTSSSLLSSPPSHNGMDNSFSSPFHAQFGRENTPSLFSARTRKRFRDNRPSEASIHQHTLSMLYSAQQTRTPEMTIEVPASQPETVRNYSSLSSKQTSLHSFWTLPSRPSSSRSSAMSNSPPPAPAASSVKPTNCEDCATGLVSGNGDLMDIDMDIDVLGNEQDHGCGSCGKQVCHKCAVSDIGEQRMCLGCAKQKQWGGEIGWMDQD